MDNQKEERKQEEEKRPRGYPIKRIESDMGRSDYSRLSIEEIMCLERELLAQLYDRLGIRVSGVGWAGPGHTLETIKKIAASPNVHVLVEGETGVGKTRVAEIIHALTPGRHAKPFEIIDVGRFGKEFVEDELFGHERGSFTGASSLLRGALERVDGGTILLDEFAEIDLFLQIKFLYILENSGQQKFRRLGGSKKIETNVRFIFASSKKLAQLVQEGKFRNDLLYRISVVKIRIPPLRERKTDIPPLASFFVEEWNRDNCLAYDLGGRVKSLDERAMEILMDYGWPGNVRQLKNVIYRACVLKDAGVNVLERDYIVSILEDETRQKKEIEVSNKSGRGGLRGGLVSQGIIRFKIPCDLDDEVTNFKKEILGRAYKIYGGNHSMMARSLGFNHAKSIIRYCKILGVNEKKS